MTKLEELIQAANQAIAYGDSVDIFNCLVLIKNGLSQLQTDTEKFQEAGVVVDTHICADHRGRIEANIYLPIDTILYTKVKV